jgi:hypothetical protein
MIHHPRFGRYCARSPAGRGKLSSVPALGIHLTGAGLLVAAGAAKVARPADVARALAGAWPRTPPGVWRPAVRALGTLEVALGAVAIVRPGRTAAGAVGATYLGFAGWVLGSRARGSPLATCGCFATPDTPPTLLHAAIDVVVAGGALRLARSAPSGSILTVLAARPARGVPLVAASAAAGGLAYLAMVPLARGRAPGR